jgi:aspartate aminotransferase
VVLVLAPFWVSYPALVRMADGVPVVLDAVPDSGFLHAPEAVLAAARKHGAKGIILNFPNNPSGVVPSAAQVQAYVDVARQADLWILSDEIYGQLTYDGTRHVSPAAVPGGKERTIVVNGFTKSHTLTGWRISFLAGPKPVIDACTRIQSQVLGNACTISQEAAIAACRIPLAEELQARLRAFDERRRFLVDAVNAIPRLRASMPRGAFYVMLDVRNLLGGDDVAFAERLLDKHLLAGVPGSAFGAPGFLRLSYAASMQDLQKAVERLRACVEGIR